MSERAKFTEMECKAFVDWVGQADMKGERSIFFKGVEYRASRRAGNAG